MKIKIGAILTAFALLISVYSSFVIPQASAQVCTPLNSAPDLYQVSRIDGTSATVYFTPINDQISGYTVFYGLTPEDQRYSTTFSYGTSTGAVTYTIGDLNPQQTYFFAVRANNSCGSSSPLSAWVGDNYTASDTSISATGSATQTRAVGGARIPVTGPETTLLAMALPLAGIILGIVLFTYPIRKRA